jgi:ribonuclease PH
MRLDGRAADALRNVEMVLGFHRPSEGSVLYRAGGTVVLCTVSIDDKVPAFLVGQNKGWLTAEYLMHPRANPKRQDRDGRGKAPSGRTQEIQRLVGRALRSAVMLEEIGERTITIDCDVLEADGGTRTAAITGAWVALAVALAKLQGAGALSRPVLHAQVAATSVGMVKDEFLLDLAYVEDSRARVDLNVVATDRQELIEIQGTAEGKPVARSAMDGMVDIALKGVAELCALQRRVLEQNGIMLSRLLVPADAPRS